MLRQFRLSLSVRPSVTRVLRIKMAERIIEILSRSDRPIILVFCHQGSLSKSDGFTPNGGAEYKGVSIFDQYAVYLGNGNRYRAMHYSAKRGLAIACRPSVCDVGDL